VNLILNLSSEADRRMAAIATSNGAALFYSFGNFCALAALPDRESVRRINHLKGRPLDQVGSVTTDPARARAVFDWHGLDRARIEAVMDDFLALGPIGLRGPAAAHVPEHLTARGTVQLISPGYACPSNALIGDILDRASKDILFITSANRSSTVTTQVEAAHCEMRAIRDEFGDRPEAVLIGHPDEHAARLRYPRHLPCSTTIIAFERDALVLERHGSLGIDDARAIAARHGLELTVASHERVPVRWPGTAVGSFAA
jgi:tRNA A37 threonylcarbamoyladenosine synthetase subunit TsaC/SUA5/YrdC